MMSIADIDTEMAQVCEVLSSDWRAGLSKTESGRTSPRRGRSESTAGSAGLDTPVRQDSHAALPRTRR